MKPNKLSAEDLFSLQDAKRNMAYAKLLREKAETQVQLSIAEENAAALSHRNILLTIYLRYGLHMEDKIESDGTITYHTESEPILELSAAAEEPPKAAKSKKESK